MLGQPLWRGGGRGAFGNGYVFEMAKTSAGYGSPTTLVNLTARSRPYCANSLIIDAAGNLFGTGAVGVFEIAKTSDGYADTATEVYTVDGITNPGLVADAAEQLVGDVGDPATIYELSGSGFQTLSPGLWGGGDTVGYAHGRPPASVDTRLGVVDLHGLTLASAKVDISAGFLAGDELNFTNQDGIDGSYDANSGMLTLAGLTSWRTIRRRWTPSPTARQSPIRPTQALTCTGTSTGQSTTA